MIEVSDTLIAKNFAVYRANSFYDCIYAYTSDVMDAVGYQPFEDDVDYIATKSGYQWQDQTLKEMISDALSREPYICLTDDKLSRVYGTELSTHRWLIWSTWQLNNITLVNEQCMKRSTL